MRGIKVDAADGDEACVATRDETKICAEATSNVVHEPIMTQFFTRRSWLWLQWRSTIARAVLPREVLANMGVATLLVLFLDGPGPQYAWRQSLIPRLAGVNSVWLLASSLVTFTISFFLSQAYSVWCAVLTISRRVQGRLNDLSLLCAASAARCQDDQNTYTRGAEQLLLVVGRYVRLFNILLYGL